MSTLAAVLARHNVPVWYSRINMGSGNWYDQVGAALKRCDWVVVVMSPSSAKSEWVKHEFLFAMKVKSSDRVIPIHYVPGGYKAPFSLEDTHFWALTNLDVKDFTGKRVDGYRALLKVWGIGYRPK